MKPYRAPSVHTPLIHLSDWAQQPDVRIKCSQQWTTPAWEEVKLPEGVYAADNGDLYTFVDEVVTCETCKQG